MIKKKINVCEDVALQNACKENGIILSKKNVNKNPVAYVDSTGVLRVIAAKNKEKNIGIMERKTSSAITSESYKNSLKKGIHVAIVDKNIIASKEDVEIVRGKVAKGLARRAHLSTSSEKDGKVSKKNNLGFRDMKAGKKRPVR